MKIVLRVDGKDKTFTNDFVSAFHYRKALQLNKELLTNDELDDVAIYDLMAEFIVSVFGKQFTIEEFWNGLSYDKLQVESKRILQTVLGVIQAESDEEVESEGK